MVKTKQIELIDASRGEFITNDGEHAVWSSEINSAITIVSGTTLQRPETPVNGDMRYNTTLNRFEFYQDNNWVIYTPTSYNRVSVTSSPYNTNLTTKYIGVNVNSPSTINLPASPTEEYYLIIKDESGAANTNNITINGNGKNIDGNSTFVIVSNYGSISMIFLNNKWNIV